MAVLHFGLLVLLYFGIASATTRPIIGILTQPTDGGLTKYGKSYIAASYVKDLFLGERKLFCNFLNCSTHSSSESELRHIFNSVNGVLFPGGGSSLQNTPLFKAGQFLLEAAIKENEMGGYFPLQGHCMGFELINMIVSGNLTLLGYYDAENITLPLDFTSDFRSSRIFSKAPQEIIDILTKQPVTMNNHERGVGDADYQANPSLSSFFHVLSHNKDRKGKVFISTIEGKKHPIYALQWHPEKNLFEWWSKEVIQHSPDAVKAVQYMADFFVSESLKNNHKFADEEEEFSSLIWNYNPIYTAKVTPDFVQCYVFDR